LTAGIPEGVKTLTATRAAGNLTPRPDQTSKEKAEKNLDCRRNAEEIGRTDRTLIKRSYVPRRLTR
jgi:hypothetical protein